MPKNEDLKEKKNCKNIVITENNERIELSDYQVSKRTARYIDLRVDLDGFWSEMYDVLELDYGDDIANKILEQDFTPLLSQISEHIDNYIIDSITEELPIVDLYKVI